MTTTGWTGTLHGVPGTTSRRRARLTRPVTPTRRPGAAPPPRAGPGPAGAPGPARGALGPSSGRDDRPGEETGPPWERTSPPWELPGWDEARPRDDSAHPSGPLPQVSSGPLPRLPPEAWPPPVSEPRRAGGRDDTSYLRTGYTDPGYARVGSGYSADNGADHAEQSLLGTGFARGEYPSRGGGTGGSGYHEPDPGYDDTGYHAGFPPRGSDPGEDYAQASDSHGGDYPGYDREPRYPEEPGYSAGSGYPDEPGYPGEPGYRDGGDYPGGDYPGGDSPGGHYPGGAEPGGAHPARPGPPPSG